jgi:hypothetical protein
MMKSFISAMRDGQVPDDAMRGQEHVAIDAQVFGLVDQIGSLDECYANLLNAATLPGLEGEIEQFFRE